MRSSLIWAWALLLGLPSSWAQTPAASSSPSDTQEQSTQTLTVTWEQGLLSVSAHRLSLHRVLTAIASKTGLAIDSAASVDSQLVYIEAGPGSMRDVLKQVLDGDGTNYILLGSSTRPGFVERLIVSGRGQQTGTSTQPTQVAVAQPPITTSEVDEFGQESIETGPSPRTAPTPVVEFHEQAPSTALPAVQQNINTQMSAYQNAFNEAAKSGKTRAEILDELQKQQIKDLDAASQPPPQ